jgi:DNA-binding response OmpR family regulator
LKNSPAPLALTNEVLAVSGSDEDLSRLRATFVGSSWELHTARTVDEAGASLSGNTTPVVLCACHLPDGDWKALLRLAGGLAHPPNLIVFTRLADDRLWAEVLSLGGFDVVAFPVNRVELFRAISSAWRNWRDRSPAHCAASGAAANSL